MMVKAWLGYIWIIVGRDGHFRVYIVVYVYCLLLTVGSELKADVLG